MTYVLQLCKDPDFQMNEGYLRSLHFMMMQYDLSSETELKGQYLGQIETMPVGSIPGFLTNLEQQWKNRKADSMKRLQGIQGLRSMGERK